MSDQAFTCPRGAEAPASAPASMRGENAIWRPQGTCSYCGSLSEEQFFDAVDRGEVVIPTDKPYKVYLGPARRKFYFQHLSAAGKVRFVEYLNNRRFTMGYPGHFYVTPYFVVFPEHAD